MQRRVSLSACAGSVPRAQSSALSHAIVSVCVMQRSVSLSACVGTVPTSAEQCNSRTHKHCVTLDLSFVNRL